MPPPHCLQSTPSSPHPHSLQICLCGPHPWNPVGGSCIIFVSWGWVPAALVLILYAAVPAAAVVFPFQNISSGFLLIPCAAVPAASLLIPCKAVCGSSFILVSCGCWPPPHSRTGKDSLNVVPGNAKVRFKCLVSRPLNTQHVVEY